MKKSEKKVDISEISPEVESVVEEGGQENVSENGATEEPKPVLTTEEVKTMMREKGNRQPLWVTMFAIVGVFLGLLLIGSVIQMFLTKSDSADPGFAQFVIYLLVFTLTIGFALWILIARGMRRPILKFSLRKSDPTIILWGLILFIIASVVIEPLIALFPDTNLDLLGKIPLMGGWAMVTTVVLAPLLEEMLFRGIIQESITREYGALTGVLLGALLFALAHISIPQQAMTAFFMGIILGYIYIITQSLVPVIIIHALNNAITYIMMSIFDSPFISVSEIVPNKVVYWIIYGGSVVIFIVAAIKILTQVRKLDRKEQAS